MIIYIILLTFNWLCTSYAAHFYDIKQSFTENVHANPSALIIPEIKRTPKKQWIDFLGYKIASPIGIPACSIMTGKNIAILSKLGFDVLTYKTIRATANSAHPLPNIAYIDRKNYIKINEIGSAISTIDKKPEKIAIANSFGNPSFDPKFTKYDIQKAKNSLQEGQVLIVSIFGESNKEFINAALIAEQAGADIIEANFSCPNLSNNNQPIYNNPDLVLNIASALNAIITKPLIIKVGVFSDRDLLKNVIVSAVKAKVKGICGINSVPMRIVSKDGTSAFASREYAGVSGKPIKQLALNFIKTTKEIIDQENLDMRILATGGIIHAKDFVQFLASGAHIALSATGAMWDPHIAVKFHAFQNLKK